MHSLTHALKLSWFLTIWQPLDSVWNPDRWICIFCFCIVLPLGFLEVQAHGKITSYRILSVTGSNKTGRDLAWIGNAKTAALRLRNGDEGGVAVLQVLYRQFREETIIGFATRPLTVMISARRHFLINTCSYLKVTVLLTSFVVSSVPDSRLLAEEILFSSRLAKRYNIKRNSFQ